MNQEDVQKRIFDAAKEVFTQKGYAAASMREIAEKADVNKGLLHYYKWNKRKLFLQVFEEAFRIFALRANEIFESDRSIREKIEVFVEQYMDLLLANPHLPAFVISELNQHPEEFVQHVMRQSRRPDPSNFLLQLQLAGESGQIRPVHPFHFFLHLLSMCVFPFLARPMIQGLLKIDEATYDQLMARRKAEVISFVNHSIGLG